MKKEYKSYSEKLRDPRWQKKRLEVLSKFEFKCSECNDEKKTLNVHHKFYKKGKDPWDYECNELEVLCEECHKIREKLITSAIRHIGYFNNDNLELLNMIFEVTSVGPWSFRSLGVFISNLKRDIEFLKDEEMK